MSKLLDLMNLSEDDWEIQYKQRVKVATEAEDQVGELELALAMRSNRAEYSDEELRILCKAFDLLDRFVEECWPDRLRAAKAWVKESES